MRVTKLPAAKTGLLSLLLGAALGCSSVVEVVDGGASTTSSTGTSTVACVTPADCPGTDTPCQQRTCTAGTCGLSYSPTGTATLDQIPGDCLLAVCDGNGGITSQPDDTDLPDDANSCTADLCTAGVSSHTSEPLGTACGDALICDGAGQCVGCVSPSDCPGQDTTCQQRACNAGICAVTHAPANQPLPAAEQTAGDCQVAICDGMGGITTIADDTDLPTSTNDCAAGACTNGATSTTPLAAGTACNQNGGVMCDGAGACVECNQGSDCTSGVCQGHVCQAPTCSDGVRNQGELGTDCGGPCAKVCPTVIVIATGPSGTFGATYHPGGEWTTTTSLGGMSTDPPSVAFTSTGEAVGGIRLTQSGSPSDGHLQYATWAAESWTGFTDVGAGIATTHGPSVSAAGTSASAAYRGLDGKYHLLTRSGGVWSPALPVLSIQGVHSSGVSAPAYTQAAGVLAFVGDDYRLYGQYGGGWGWYAAELIGDCDDVMPTVTTVPLGFAALGFIRGKTGTFASFSNQLGAVQPFDGVTPTSDPVAVLGAPQSTIVAYRRQDGYVYSWTYSGGPYVIQPISTPNVMAVSAPVLAPGTAGATAEIAFIQPDGVAYHSRLIGNAWTPPVAIGGSNLTHVAIASWSP